MNDNVAFRGRSIRSTYVWTAAGGIAAFVGVPVPAMAVMWVGVSVGGPIIGLALLGGAGALIAAWAYAVKNSSRSLTIGALAVTAWWILSGALLSAVIWLNPATPSTDEMAVLVIVVAEFGVYVAGSAAAAGILYEVSRRHRIQS